MLKYVSNKQRIYRGDSELSKILGAIWFVAKRRTTGRREYLQIIRQYVGLRLDEGVSLRIDPKLGNGPSLDELKEVFLNKQF